MTKIDARLLLPGELFLDPDGAVDTPLAVVSIATRTDEVDGDAPVVKLFAKRSDDGHTPVVRVLGAGDEVERVPPKPEVVFDAATGTWKLAGQPAPEPSKLTELEVGKQYRVLPGARSSDPQNFRAPTVDEIVRVTRTVDPDGDAEVVEGETYRWVLPEYLQPV